MPLIVANGLVVAHELRLARISASFTGFLARESAGIIGDRFKTRTVPSTASSLARGLPVVSVPGNKQWSTDPETLKTDPDRRSLG